MKISIEIDMDNVVRPGIILISHKPDGQEIWGWEYKDPSKTTIKINHNVPEPKKEDSPENKDPDIKKPLNDEE